MNIRGAATAAAASGEAEGHLPSLLDMIRPAVERAKGQPGDLIDNAVRINVENVVRQIRGSKPVLAPLVIAERADGGRRGVFARLRQTRVAAGWSGQDGGMAGTAARISAMRGKPLSEEGEGRRRQAGCRHPAASARVVVDSGA